MRKIAFYAAGLCGLLGLSFAVGLHAGAERTALFEFVRGAKTRLERYLTSPKEAPPAADPGVARLYDAASIARAQAEGTPPPDYLDWTGFYRVANAQSDLGGFRPLNPELPPVILAHLQPWARARMAATDGVADETSAICQPAGLFRATTSFAGGFLWLPGPDKIVLVYATPEVSGVQRVYLNRTHPGNLLPTWNGDSVGYWEKDTLVVDTIGFNDKSWLDRGMEPHTEEARLIQRIRRVGDGAFLEIHYTVEDRKALTSAYTYSRYYRRVGDSMPEEVCNDYVQPWREFRNEALRRQLERARRVQAP